MNVKNVNEFTLEECKKYLETNPTGFLVEDVKKKMNALLEKDAKKSESPSKGIQWISYAQFIRERPYHKNTIFGKVVYLIICILCILLIQIQTLKTEGIKGIIIVSVITIVLFAIGLWVMTKYSSPFRGILYIEKTDNKFTLLQAKNGKMGLAICEEKRIRPLLPCIYTNIYQCNNNLYICINKREKYGVINAQLNKMVVPVIYDKIVKEKDNSLLLIKDNIKTKFAI